ncbi:MAG TPA: ATP-binding protein [Patescibacteria group bacterium]|nr:ATP-binding protein [Patescibacteria group bacterium]
MSAPALLRIEFTARAESLSEVRAAVQRTLFAQGVDGRDAARIVLAIDEACANVIRHAYRGCGDGKIDLRIERHRGALRFRLRDRAPAVDPGCVKPRDLSVCRPGGLGINIIDDTMDHWRLRPLKRCAGNVLTMVRRLRARSA